MLLNLNNQGRPIHDCWITYDVLLIILIFKNVYTEVLAYPQQGAQSVSSISQAGMTE